MKKILSSPSPYEISQLKTTLESAGIACVVRNEASAGFANDIAFQECIPQLWIDDDSKLDEALKIKELLKTPAAETGVAWDCPKCGE